MVRSRRLSGTMVDESEWSWVMGFLMVRSSLVEESEMEPSHGLSHGTDNRVEEVSQLRLFEEGGENWNPIYAFGIWCTCFSTLSRGFSILASFRCNPGLNDLSYAAACIWAGPSLFFGLVVFWCFLLQTNLLWPIRKRKPTIVWDGDEEDEREKLEVEDEPRDVDLGEDGL